jgi:hypothetical protein
MKVSQNTFFLPVVSFLCTSAAAAAAIQVFPNFLSSNEVEHYRQEAAAAARNNGNKAPHSSEYHHHHHHHRRQLTTVATVTLQENVHDMVRTALLTPAGSSEGGWVKKLMLDTQAPVTTLTSTLKSHVDYYYQVRIIMNEECVTAIFGSFLLQLRPSSF